MTIVGLALRIHLPLSTLPLVLHLDIAGSCRWPQLTYLLAFKANIAITFCAPIRKSPAGTMKCNWIPDLLRIPQCRQERCWTAQCHPGSCCQTVSILKTIFLQIIERQRWLQWQQWQHWQQGLSAENKKSPALISFNKSRFALNVLS